MNQNCTWRHHQQSKHSVQQYARMSVSSRGENYPMAPQQQRQPLHANQPQNQAPIAPVRAKHATTASTPSGVTTTTLGACFNCDDPSHFVGDCPLKDRAQKPLQQLVISCHTNPSGGWTCPSQPYGMNHEVFPASLPVRGIVAFCINCGRTEHSASECMPPENIRQEEQVRAPWYALLTNQFDGTRQDDQVRVLSVAEAGGPSRPIVIACDEKQVLTKLEPPAQDCTETLISIHLLLPAEQNLRPTLTLAQLKENLCRNTKYTIAARPLPHFAREDETKLAPVQKVKTISTVPVAIKIDGVDMKFDAIVVLEGHFPQGLYLGQPGVAMLQHWCAGRTRGSSKGPTLVVAFVPSGCCRMPYSYTPPTAINKYHWHS